MSNAPRMVVTPSGVTYVPVSDAEVAAEAIRDAERRQRQDLKLKLPLVTRERITAPVRFKATLFAADSANADRIMKLAQAASFAVIQGAGDKLDWMRPGINFTYGDAGGQRVELTANDVVELARAVGAQERIELLRAQHIGARMAKGEAIDLDDPKQWAFDPEVHTKPEDVVVVSAASPE